MSYKTITQTIQETRILQGELNDLESDIAVLESQLLELKLALAPLKARRKDLKKSIQDLMMVNTFYICDIKRSRRHRVESHRTTRRKLSIQTSK